MLYLHCGWPHTGTSSFQAALWKKRDRLARAGVLYPDMSMRERSNHLGGHHRILALLGPDTTDSAGIRRFQDYLRSNAEPETLISTEGLSGWFEDGKRQSLLKLLEALREVTPVTCIMTLRRADEFFSSRYNHRLLIDPPPPSPTAYSLSISQWHVALGFPRWLTGLAGIREVSDVLDGNLVCCAYDHSGAHNDYILRAAGITNSVRAEVIEQVDQEVRVNTRLSRKAIVAMLHLDTISARIGAPLSQQELRKAWRAGRLRFESDDRCELLESNLRTAIHEKALEVSREVGLDPYVELLEQVEIEPSAPASLDPDLLTAEDVERLRRFCAAP
jgi:hypothetical protein